MPISGAIAAFVLAAQLAAPITVEEKAAITNFYLHMREIQAAEDAKPPEPVNTSSPGFATHRTFPFEAYDHLDAPDLMRAVSEGIEDAEAKLPDGDPEVILSAQMENVQFVLQFFPFIATDAAAVERLRYAMQDTNEQLPLRLYLIKQLIPGAYPSSLFQKFLIDQTLTNRDQYKRLFGDMIQSPQETPQMRELAMEALWHTMYSPYLALFLGDPNVEKRVEETGTQLTPRVMIEDKTLQLTNRTNVPFKEQTADFVSLAEAYSQQLNPLKQRPESTQQKAREMIQRILTEIPVEDPAAIEALLHGPPAPSFAAPVFPTDLQMLAPGEAVPLDGAANATPPTESEAPAIENR